VIQIQGTVDPTSNIIALIGEGQPYKDITSTSPEGQGTVMTLLDGANLHSQTEAISAVWTAMTPGDTPISDTLTLEGIQGDVFVLDMTYDPALMAGRVGPPFIAMKTQDGWQRVGDPAKGPVEGGYLHPQDDDVEALLGQWGWYEDAGMGHAWVVTNHNSQFAVVPEPGSLLMLLGAALGLAFACRRRK